MAKEATGTSPGINLNGLLLGAVILLMLTGTLLATALYVLPGERLDIPETQAAVRIESEAHFPVGSSRVQNWGETVVLVVRRAEREYHALQGTSPTDGCTLTWDAESLRVVSPCTHVVYDLRGNVVRGLTREPLHRFPVFVRNGVVYVATRPTEGG
jgi:nitrite reductase/ring-hydroxylating ferredoxin subunit